MRVGWGGWHHPWFLVLVVVVLVVVVLVLVLVAPRPAEYINTSCPRPARDPPRR